MQIFAAKQQQNTLHVVGDLLDLLWSAQLFALTGHAENSVMVYISA